MKESSTATWRELELGREGESPVEAEEFSMVLLVESRGLGWHAQNAHEAPSAQVKSRVSRMPRLCASRHHPGSDD